MFLNVSHVQCVHSSKVVNWAKVCGTPTLVEGGTGFCKLALGSVVMTFSLVRPGLGPGSDSIHTEKTPRTSWCLCFFCWIFSILRCCKCLFLAFSPTAEQKFPEVKVVLTHRVTSALIPRWCYRVQQKSSLANCSQLADSLNHAASERDEGPPVGLLSW